jgi:hypothetical protein
MRFARFDIQFRAPYSPNPDGFYYWTNRHYLRIGDTPFPIAGYVHIFEGYQVCNFYAVQFNWFILSSPPGELPYIFNASMGNDPGSTLLTGPFILENIARVHFFAGDDYVGYKLLRGVVGVDEVENGQLTSTALARLQDNLEFYWFQNDMRTADDRAITSLEVKPDIHHWNLRHGTKRRERGVIHTP